MGEISPIVLVELSDGTRAIGDGRGRTSFALGNDWETVPAIFLREV